MAAVVYTLCTIASLTCAFLLFRSWSKSKSRFLFLCFIGFLGITVNNIILFIDVIIFPDVTYIIPYRSLPGVFGMMVMIYGLIMEEV